MTFEQIAEKRNRSFAAAAEGSDGFTCVRTDDAYRWDGGSPISTVFSLLGVRKERVLEALTE